MCKPTRWHMICVESVGGAAGLSTERDLGGAKARLVNKHGVSS